MPNVKIGGATNKTKKIEFSMAKLLSPATHGNNIERVAQKVTHDTITER